MSQTLTAAPSAATPTAQGVSRAVRTLEAAHPLHRLSPDARDAWRSTLFAAMPPRVTATILERAVEVSLEPGEIFYRGADRAQTPLPCAVVIDGLLRFYISVPDGRAMTIRYADRGNVIGMQGIAIGACSPQRTAINGEALQASRALVLPRQAVIAAATNNAAFSLALAREIALQAVRNQELIMTNVFSPVRQRVARHLINLATRDGQDLVVHASHQAIADAIGSVREVVSRTLCRFAAEGLVKRRGRCLIVVDAPLLHAVSTS